MIGILLALEVNDWSEKIKIKKLEIRTLNELSISLEEDIVSLQEDSAMLCANMQKLHILIEHIAKQYPFHDSLSSYLANAHVMRILPLNEDTNW
jgi:hypothetical protein